jgi:general secretion pathway protein G
MRIFCRLNSSGLTLIELVIAMAILAILASAVLPMAEVTVIRTKELELRRALREVRTAIDNYKADYDRAVAEKKIFATVDESGYPESLELLLEGNDWGGMYSYKKRYLRRMPRDPFDKYDDGWGECSYEDEPP